VTIVNKMLTFLDQNALIALGKKARDSHFRKKLDDALAAKSLNVVASTWQLVETANTTKLEGALELARFIDSLKPAWLFERLDLQAFDVEDDFYASLKISFTKKGRVTTRSAVLAALHRGKDGPKYEISSEDFVKQWVQNPSQLSPIVQSFEQSSKILTRLREQKKEGLITDRIRDTVNEILVRRILPEYTPSGVFVGREARNDYVQQVVETRAQAIPSIAIETAISEYSWLGYGGVDRNTVIDKFLMISALPHVDELVTNDGGFHTLHPIASKTGHVRANVIHNEEFLKGFE
jgi:hypothetical protein